MKLRIVVPSPERPAKHGTGGNNNFLTRNGKLRLARELLVSHPVRDDRVLPQTAQLVGLVVLEIALEPPDVTVVLEGGCERRVSSSRARPTAGCHVNHCVKIHNIISSENGQKASALPDARSGSPP